MNNNNNNDAKKQRRASTSRRGSQRRLSVEGGEVGVASPRPTGRRRSSLQRTAAAAAAEEEEKDHSSDHINLSTQPKEPVVLSAEVVYSEPVEVVSTGDAAAKVSKKGTIKRRKQPKKRASVEEEEKTSNSPGNQTVSATTVQSTITTTSTTTTTTPNHYNNNDDNDPSRPKYPRSLLGMVVRMVKILHALLNIIVIRGSVLTRRKLNHKLQDYLVSSQSLSSITAEDNYEGGDTIVALYHEHIAHHLFVFYLSWGRLLVCLIVLMWGTCTSRLPKPFAIYIGMAMHWVDSIRALDSHHWLPSAKDGDDNSNNNDYYERDPNRALTAEEEVQTAMAWLHLFWFLVDGFYCRQILQKRKLEEQRIQRELYLELVGEEQQEDHNNNNKKRN